MDDFYFENELRKRERDKLFESTKDYFVDFSLQGNMMSLPTVCVYGKYGDAVEKYMDIKYAEVTDWDERLRHEDEFRKKLSDVNLKEMYENYNFSEDEIRYIMYCNLSRSWRGEKGFSSMAREAITEILLRKIIKDEFQDDRLLPPMPSREEISEEFAKCLDDKSRYWFNQDINCGGYALKVDQCVFPTYQENLGQTVSSILEKFPFVRLLGDQGLSDDEYLVIYRATPGKCVGHHFVRVDSDGIVREKHENGEPMTFESWENLEDAPEVLFAVKKDHKMFGYESSEVNYNNRGKDFDETIADSIAKKQNAFSYHGHNYRLKKASDNPGEIVVIDGDGEKIAWVIADDEDCLVDVREDKKAYVDNYSSNVKPRIVNGRLVNHEEFMAKNTKERKEQEDAKRPGEEPKIDYWEKLL